MWYDNYCNNSSCWSTTTIRRNPQIISRSSATITSEILLAALSRFSEKGRWLNHMLSSGTSEHRTCRFFRQQWICAMDQHQPQPEYEVGCDSERESLCPQDSERVNKTTPGASSSERLEHQVPGDWLPQTICQVDSSSSSEELMERSTSRNSTILQRISICRARRSTNFTIKYWTVYVQIFVKILPIIRIVCSTLRFGANLRSTDDGIHLELQRITTTSKRWWWIITFFKDARFYTVSTTTSADTDQTQRCIRHARIAGLENIFVPRITLLSNPAAKLMRMWQFTSSQILHCVLDSQIQIHPIIVQRNLRMYWTNMDLSKNWIWQPEKCYSFGTYYQGASTFTSRGIFMNTWKGNFQNLSVTGSYSCQCSTALTGQRKAIQKLVCTKLKRRQHLRPNSSQNIGASWGQRQKVHCGTDIPANLKDN